MPYLPSLPADAAVMDVLKAYPETAAPLIDYQQVVLRGPSPLTVAERELIAAYVSGLNACHYCHGVHGAVAERFGIEEGVLAALLTDVATAPVRDELKPLFRYVRKLTETPSRMTQADADAVFAAGWTEKALFDTVSVCALFNFMNRLVEGVGLIATDAYFTAAADRLSRGTMAKHTVGEPDVLVPVPDTWDRVGAIDVPVLAVHGALDSPDHLGMAERLVGTVKDGRAVNVDGAAHYPNLERPAAYDELLGAFLLRP